MDNNMLDNIYYLVSKYRLSTVQSLNLLISCSLYRQVYVHQHVENVSDQITLYVFDFSSDLILTRSRGVILHITVLSGFLVMKLSD